MVACKNGHLHFISRKPCWWKFHSSDPTPCSLTALHSSKAVYRINSKWSMNCLSGRPCYLFQWCTRSHNNWAARSKIKQNIYALLVEYTSHNSQIWHVVSLVYDEGDGWCLRFLVCTRILCSWSTYHSAPSHPPSTDWIRSLRISRSSELLISWSADVLRFKFCWGQVRRSIRKWHLAFSTNKFHNNFYHFISQQTMIELFFSSHNFIRYVFS